jgi:two-component system chemotaxis sensor kinase CheA
MSQTAASDTSMPHDAKVQEIFVESCLEQLKNIEKSILDLESVDLEGQPKTVAAIFRAAHSIKGDAASMGVVNVNVLAHRIENVLEPVRDGLMPIDGELISALLNGFDLLRELVSSPDLGHGRDLSATYERWDKLAARSTIAPPPVQETEPASAPPRETPAAPPPVQGLESASGRITHLSIQAGELDTLVNRIGELAILQTRLQRAARSEKHPIFLPLSEEIESLCSLLRDQVLGMRMLPLQVSFPKYRRLIRDLCAQLGKRAELVMEGHNTELDKKLIEELNSPLIHLLRNAMDHGIETPRVRAEQGKTPQATITLTASQVGGEVVIEVGDDGAGIDAEKLRRRAVAAGRLDPEQRLSPEELLGLIYLPGLSTAETVDNISGRGVGMDAVRESITALRGKIEIQSELGKGTTFRLRLPISLAIIDCLQIDVAGEDYFLHLDYVEECLELKLNEHEREHGARLLNCRGVPLPLIALRNFFLIPGLAPQRAHVIVVRTGQGSFGLVADEVKGQHQAVLKQLGPAVGKVEGVLGATVTEQGHMGLILDIPGLAQRALSEEDGHWEL